MDEILAVAGLVMIVLGIVKRKRSWGKTVLLVGVVAFGLSAYLGRQDFIDGLNAGKHRVTSDLR